MMLFTFSCRRADYQLGSADLKHSTTFKTGARQLHGFGYCAYVSDTNLTKSRRRLVPVAIGLRRSIVEVGWKLAGEQKLHFAS
jgi:hypothetical protein